jgi:hypothetical protein
MGYKAQSTNFFQESEILGGMAYSSWHMGHSYLNKKAGVFHRLPINFYVIVTMNYTP